jgi:hypothetical protein
MYYTGLDPFTLKEVHIARALRDRKSQRAMMQFFKPENYFEVRDALREAGRSDLIGEGCDCLIPSRPPKEAVERRREDANKRFRGEYVHTIPNNSPAGSPKSDTPKVSEGGPRNTSNATSSAPGSKKKKGSQKKQRESGGSGGKPGTGYRPGRRV